ncbi:MAG: endonuclease [Planctomycetota bacterium]|nr:endonuclease [Planctomycetota bacterium]
MMVLKRTPTLLLVLLLQWFCLLSTGPLQADPPPGYYNPANGLAGEALRQALHSIIDDHQRFPYTSSATDTWDIVGAADEDPANLANVINFYRNTSVPWSAQNTSNGWNREHTWPSSYGYTNDNSCNYPFSDVHHLHAASPSYNSARGNSPYDWCSTSCSSWSAEGTPFSNLATGSGNSGSWQVWEDRRGDAARSIFYMETRYEGGNHSISGCSEPDLRLTDNRSLIVSNTSANQSVAYMGLLSTLLEWHIEDPVSAEEQLRNDVVYGYQGNRNPYIDHPEYACMIWVCPTSDTTPPSIPNGISAVAGECQVTVDWADNSESDLSGYFVYRSTVAVGPFTLLTTTGAVSNLIDTAVAGATQYHYQVTAIDVSGNESFAGSTVSAVPLTGQGCGAPPPDPGAVNLIISELMPNPAVVSDAAGEWFEIFNRGTDTIDLNGWTIRDDDTDLHQINAPGGLLIAPYEFLVLARDGNVATNGGVVADYVYGGNLILANSADEVVLIDPLAVERARVMYSSATWPYLAGFSAEILDLLAIVPGDPTVWITATTPYGSGDLGSPGGPGSAIIPPPPGPRSFIRGDANRDSAVDISDPILLLDLLFGNSTQLSCEDAGDANDDGSIDISDAVAVLQALFSGAGPLPQPYPLEGDDPTPDALGC